MNGCNQAIDWRLIGAILAGLFFFGLAYNALVQVLGDRKDGYTAFLVVAGVLVTLCGLALVSWEYALLALSLFAASGAPMILGDIYRSIQRRDKALEALRGGRTGRDDEP